MRLINVDTLKLESFVDHRNAPDYAILSHTWCGPNDEVLFQEMEHLTDATKEKKGWKKIEYTCIQAKKDELQYAWVDTCCIDKSSSAELSEAINSMYAWYEKSRVCYAYLADVDVKQVSAEADDGGPANAEDTGPPSEPENPVVSGGNAVRDSEKALQEKQEAEAAPESKTGEPNVDLARCNAPRASSNEADQNGAAFLRERATSDDETPTNTTNAESQSNDKFSRGCDPLPFEEEFKASRGFTRGWTPQELLAPKHVQFFSGQWTRLGSLTDLADAVSKVTAISMTMLYREFPTTSYCAAKRMSWASRRETTRLEDEAYCLLGLFNINMPLLYGEGRNAFKRLQEEILRGTEDLSLLAWSNFDGALPYSEPMIFAGAPSKFMTSGRIRTSNSKRRTRIR